MISEYVVLSRKYRPKFFKDVIGQDFFIQTIKNCIKMNKIGHSFLLHGIRGIGKTTIARIVAKALNCSNLSADIEPCGVCESCIAINNDSHIDVIEIDAASNTGVDDIRTIIDSCIYKSVMGKYKIYIIDEVHMLSKSAFNAFLKTLEEPPEHIKFILATTELSKIPKTVLSRCAIKLNLKRINPELIVNHLQHICNIEKIDYEIEALYLIAKNSDGSARDAISILDQTILAAKENKILLSDIEKLIGLSSLGKIQCLIDLIINCDNKAAILLIREMYSNGIEMHKLLEQMITVMHNIITSHYLNDTNNNNINDDNYDISNMYRLFYMTEKCYQYIKDVSFPLLIVEMLVIRMINITNFPSPDKILSSINLSAINKTENTEKINSIKTSEKDLTSLAKKLFTIE